MTDTRIHTLYLARHGQTEANVSGRLQGQSLDTPLTPLGIQQAQTVAEILRLHAPAELDWVSSPLQRARTTMELIREQLGLPPPDYRTETRIIEGNFGLWDGLTHDEARALDPAGFEARENDKWNVRDPGGRENYSDVAVRAESFLGDLTQDTVAVSHGMFTRILRGIVTGLTWQEMSDLDEPQGVVFKIRGCFVEKLELPLAGG
jgi:broad specificity phosphatase PhoE